MAHEINISSLTARGEKVGNVSVADYFQTSPNAPLIDVRSPGEFEKAHIPGATNIPLFNNEERALVGKTYTQNSSEEAIKLGLKIVQPKLQHFIDEARKVAPNGTITVHCWRGGMRSSSFARHLSENGFNEVKTIIGGYKAYRNYALTYFAKPFQLHNIGGFTGSGKTEILKCLRDKGSQVIDLEALANHRGSAFGGIDLPPQPTVEQFENNLCQLLNQFDNTQAIWVEDESNYLGSVFIPMPFFRQMKAQKLYFLNIPKPIRAQHLVETYSHLSPESLSEAIQKISKRLGYNRAKQAQQFLKDKDYMSVVTTCLTYYDKLYNKGLSMRNAENVVEIALNSTNHCENAELLQNLIDSKI